MNANDILDMIGDAKGTYVWDAQQVRSGNVAVVRKRLPAKRVWLIAAVIALMLLLVGCAVVYALRMQDMKVGEYSYYIPTEYDENGNVIPVESQEPITLISLQGTNMEALAEWVAFTNAYDQDGTIMQAADAAFQNGGLGNPWELPDNYHLTYGCYSQEMVDKLDEIVEKYDLKLLSEYIVFNWWESRALLDSLSLDGLLYDDSGAEYWDGELHLEGTFDLNILLTLDMGDWTWEQGIASYRYSLKEYFDPATGSMLESRDYTQWDYTRKDGKTVLLVLNEGTARIFADLPDAFVSIYLDPVIWVDGEEVPMTQDALEQFAELFDLDVKPQPTTMETVEKFKTEAQAQYDADRAAAQAEHEAQYVAGYEEFVNYRLETLPNPESASYVLYDLNGDSVEEMIISSRDYLSMKDGESYKYFDPDNIGIFFPRFQPCEGNVFEIWSEDFPTHQYYFYQANAESASFITGVSHDTDADIWYLNLDDSADGEKQQITAEKAQDILNSYTTVNIEWIPLKKFGQSYTPPAYADPYAQYIAQKLDRYENAVNYSYTLMDLNGDGVDELICRDVETKTNGVASLALSMHTIVNGEISEQSICAYICEGGILEECSEYGDGGSYHQYSRLTVDGVEVIEKIVRDPSTLYWGRVEAGKDGRTVTEEEAMSVINSYERMELDMKPFTEYPFE